MCVRARMFVCDCVCVRAHVCVIVCACARIFVCDCACVRAQVQQRQPINSCACAVFAAVADKLQHYSCNKHLLR